MIGVEHPQGCGARETALGTGPVPKALPTRMDARLWCLVRDSNQPGPDSSLIHRIRLSTLVLMSESIIDVPGDTGGGVVRVVLDIQTLAREIVMQLDPQALMDAEDVGAYLKCSARYVLEDYALAPGFPKAIRLTGPDGRRGNPRWRRRDITEWVDSHINGQSKRGGRPRKNS